MGCAAGEEVEAAAEGGSAEPLVAFDPPPFSLYSRRGCSLKEYAVEGLRLLASERGEVSLSDAWLVLRRAAERDARVRDGLTPRLVLLALKELRARGYRVRLRLR